MPSDTIEVSKQLKLLIELQEIDTRIIELQKEKKRLPEIIDKKKGILKTIETAFEDIKASYDKLLKEKREKERAIEDEDAKVERLKSKTSEIKTNKEYQAFLTEIETAKKVKTALEDNLLIILEKIEDIKKEIQAKELKVKEEERIFLAEEDKIKEDFRKLEEELKILLKEMEDKSAKIGKDILKIYTQLLESKNGLAVAAVKNGFCLGCHMNIPPQTFAEIKKNIKIIQCFNCHRIHYWKE
ncbi:MAG: hypothetical protein HZA06_01785 [Nitrospirae bacterium]|nr:hypothetical protein [Nitrospirota bacterium]